MVRGQVIRADIYDVKSHLPKAGEKYFVDSNVWLWMTYPPASMEAQPYQVDHYPTFIKRVRGQKALLFWCGLSFSELAHLIEKEEHKLYQLANQEQIQFKDLRHVPGERTKLAQVISGALKQITSMATATSITVNATAVTQALCDIESMPLDGYDLFFHQVLKRNELTRILTDDGDYASVPGIDVYTANRNILELAQTQGRLQAPPSDT